MTLTIRKTVDPDGHLRLDLPDQKPGHEVEVRIEVAEELSASLSAAAQEHHRRSIMELAGSLCDSDIEEPEDFPPRPAPSW